MTVRSFMACMNDSSSDMPDCCCIEHSIVWTSSSSTSSQDVEVVRLLDFDKAGG